MKINYIQEEWRPIKGYEGLYEVSNFGRVKSLQRNSKGKNNSIRILKEKIIKPSKNKEGYLVVCLCNNGKLKIKRVHRLVAETFIPNPYGYKEVNHKGENPSKNYVWQLEWCDSKYNSNYGTRNIRIGRNNINGKCSKPVLQYLLNEELVNTFPSIKEVERLLGFSNAHIIECCKGKRKSAYGYIWRYLD